MSKVNVKQVLSLLATDKHYTKTLEDLKYNLSIFLNEDVYFKQIKKYGNESLLIVKYLLKYNIIYMTTKDKRILLTPYGERLLTEINNMLFYVA